MMMVQYLLDANEEVRIPDIESQQTSFEDAVAPVRMALEQEQRVAEEINALFKLARDNGEYRAEQFMQWFVKEQVEEVSLMTDLLNVVERSEGEPAAGRGLHGPGEPARKERSDRAACRRRRPVATMRRRFPAINRRRSAGLEPERGHR